MTDPILISKRDAAKALSISLRTLDYLIASKELAVRRVGRRCLIPRKSLEEFAGHDHPTQANDLIASQDRSKEVSNGDRNNIA
jgi:excisionase family DNA binding protein